MKSKTNILRLLLTGTLLLVYGAGFAQIERLARAQSLYNTKDPAKVDQARIAIDSVVQHKDTKADFISWTTRAAIYFEIYKRNDKFKLNSALRDTIITSLRQSNSLKPDSTNAQYNKKLLINLAQGYYNLNIRLLQDSGDAERSLEAYTRYKALFKEVDPKADFRSRDIEYFLAVSTVFNDKYSKDSSEKSLQNSMNAYQRVLQIDPENRSANLGIGLLHYNKAAALVKQLEYGADLEQIEALQDNVVNLAKQSEQYILVVYNHNNRDPKAVEALYYVYRMLFDKVKHEDFKKKCAELGIMVNEETSGDKKSDK